MRGTYRTWSSTVRELESQGAKLIQCDITDARALSNGCKALSESAVSWDVLILAPGTQDPIGPFCQCDFDEWEESINVNFIAQLRAVRELLAYRTPAPFCATVLFFAGGGTNNAVVNYSAYTVSKIALIKMCELLDAEISDAKFVIVGPGWVKTKIHESTLRSGLRAGSHYDRTVDMLSSGNCTPMERVLDCCDWIIGSPKEIVSGRNFSVVNDPWNTRLLEKTLLENSNIYKMRRFGNDSIINKHI